MKYGKRIKEHKEDGQTAQTSATLPRMGRGRLSQKVQFNWKLRRLSKQARGISREKCLGWRSPVEAPG